MLGMKKEIANLQSILQGLLEGLCRNSDSESEEAGRVSVDRQDSMLSPSWLEMEKKKREQKSHLRFYIRHNMGSGPLHSGVVSASFEAMRTLAFVSRFVDAHDLTEVDQHKIESFEKISKVVE